jgi:glycolate oxidase iron-sulfur subunit
VNRELLDDCVHCGFCLPTCPTYALWGEEPDSPRGRILLMDLVERGELAMDAGVMQHWDRCLGCMACVTSCPSGVRYDRLIEETRAAVGRVRPRYRLLFTALPYHRRLRPAGYAIAAYRATHLPRPRLLPPVGFAALRARTPAFTPARGERRMRVAMLLGCVQRAFFGDVNAATARVLAAFGCEVLAPPEQGCCGALELHAGRPGADERRHRLLDTLGALDVDAIVVNAAGCGSALKEADHPHASRVRDVHEVLAALGPPPGLRPLELRVAYHDACHLSHAQRIRSEPREVLQFIPGLELAELSDGEMCCGSAGIYNLVQREAAAELGRRKAATVAAVRPDALAAANPGCLIQIGAYLDVPTYHPVELLDRALEVDSQFGRGPRVGRP